jgi:hypothetical protein
MGQLMRAQTLICLITSAAFVGASSAQTLSREVRAFPGADGFGAFTVGGRGGKVVKVTNLNDAGPGSLRAAISEVGPRTVIFSISGTIVLATPLVIRNPNITIAGQTAPGGGITLAGNELRISTSEVIIRYIRSRHGDVSGVEGDAISLTAGRNIIIDHCSASWSTDETLSVSQHMTTGPDQLDKVTVQWSIISESLDQSVHSKGAHGYGTLVRGSAGSRYSFHHNLWAHHRARMPRPGNFAEAKDDPRGPIFDFTNNVFYNWGGGSNDGSGYNVDETAISRYNFRANSYRQGPNSRTALAFVESAPNARAHFLGNAMNGQSVDTNTIVKLKRASEGYHSATPFETEHLEAASALFAEVQVLARAGASKSRDSIDRRIIQEVRSRTGRIINSQSDVGGWPQLTTGTALPDRDGDGMPDNWERRHRLNPAEARDGSGDRDGDGYTNLEEWMNGIAS